MPGENAAALLFMGLFDDAGWYLQGGNTFPDGLPPFAHSPQYLNLFALVLNALHVKRCADEKAAAQAARG